MLRMSQERKLLENAGHLADFQTIIMERKGGVVGDGGGVIAQERLFVLPFLFVTIYVSQSSER